MKVLLQLRAATSELDALFSDRATTKIAYGEIVRPSKLYYSASMHRLRPYAFKVAS